MEASAGQYTSARCNALSDHDLSTNSGTGTQYCQYCQSYELHVGFEVGSMMAEWRESPIQMFWWLCRRGMQGRRCIPEPQRQTRHTANPATFSSSRKRFPHQKKAFSHRTDQRLIETIMLLFPAFVTYHSPIFKERQWSLELTEHGSVTKTMHM